MFKDGRRFNFTIIENDLIDDVERFDKNDLLCYMVLCRFANNDTSKCYPSYKTIAEKMRVSQATAIKAIKSLEEKGILLVEKRKSEAGGDTSNLYTIINANKKAPTAPTVEAQPNKNNNNPSISQNNKNYTSKNKEITKGAGAKNINQRTDQYTNEDLEEIIKDKKEAKFKPMFDENGNKL